MIAEYESEHGKLPEASRQRAREFMLEMSAVSVREFSCNPSAIFARVEQGETIQVTRHSKVIAVVGPPVAVPPRHTDKIQIIAGSWSPVTLCGR